MSRSALSIGLCLFFSLCVIEFTLAQDYRLRVPIQRDDDPVSLHRLGLDFEESFEEEESEDGSIRIKRALEVYADDEHVELLKRNGFPFEYLETTKQMLERVRKEREVSKKDKDDDGGAGGDDDSRFDNFHNYNQMTALLNQIADDHKDIAVLSSIGKSVDGNELWVMELSDNPGQNEDGEPELKYVGNMHGDEVVGRENLLRFIAYLCDSYKANDERVRTLIDGSRVFIMPSMNPDGYERGQRWNANRKDLNRNFPDQFNNNKDKREPEVEAMINWSTIERNFVLSINFHGGDCVANYPWDGRQDSRSVYSKAPDDATFKSMALTYAATNDRMLSNRRFPDGITNGAAWYALDGGMQDFMYIHAGDYELTVELSFTKWPQPSTLQDYWDENRESMLNYLELGLTMGVRGVVTSETSGVPLRAAIYIHEVEEEDDTQTDTPNLHLRVYSDASDGDYFRLIGPGDYKICADLQDDGYVLNCREVNVEEGVQSVVNFEIVMDTN
eukprot:TRINITY_DN13116_c0_g1_i1.p1 TRINITY_DN13116_c0_g1~~TRINITY_DN13116_c0_g1_i1.p1  ORF type:complete len:502 (-),score=151.92 TRINITY_DN13116_c0_g1_i1:95-1600(-)